MSKTYTKEEIISAFNSGWLNGFEDGNGYDVDYHLKDNVDYYNDLSKMYLEELNYRKTVGTED